MFGNCKVLLKLLGFILHYLPSFFLPPDEKFNDVKEDKSKNSTENKKRRDKDKNVDVGATLQITAGDIR